MSICLVASVIAIFLAGFILLSFVRPEKEELLNIRFQSSGCFHQTVGKLVVYKQDSIKIARFFITGLPEKEKPITDEQYSEVQKFLRELLLLKEMNGCTTVDTYTASFRGITVKKVDGSCHWRGFSKITQSLFNWQKQDRR